MGCTLLIRNTWCIVAIQSGHFEIIPSTALLFPQAELRGRIPVRATVDIDTFLFRCCLQQVFPWLLLFDNYLPKGWNQTVS